MDGLEFPYEENIAERWTRDGLLGYNTPLDGSDGEAGMSKGHGSSFLQPKTV